MFTFNIKIRMKENKFASFLMAQIYKKEAEPEALPKIMDTFVNYKC